MSEKIVGVRNHPELLRDCVRLASADPERNLLLLADLYSPHFDLSEIYVLTRNGVAVDFSNVYRGFGSPSIVLGINTETKQRLLEHVLARVKGKFICICEPGEMSLFKGEAEILEIHNEYQMILERLIKPAERTAEGEARRVERSELGALDRFYRDAGAVAWLQIQFESGPYFCVKAEGRIASAGGVHFSTPWIAQLGNIVTAKSFRKRGYGTLCTYALAAELGSINRIVSLFVMEDNTDAIRMYEGIGFRKRRKVVYATFS